MKKTVWNPDGTVKHDANGDFTIEHTQDVEPLLEANAAERRWDAETRGAFGKRREWRKTMSVDNVTFMEVARKLGIPGKDLFSTEANRRIWKELKGRDYAKFRTTSDKNI